MKTLAALLMCSGLVVAANTFEVATVRRSSPDMGTSDRESFQGGTLRMGNVTLRQIAHYAFGISEAQIFGGPKWMEEYRFDIVAKAEPGADRNTLLSMLQPLMTERFHMVFHHETKTVAGYTLEVAKSGIRAPVSTRTDGPGSNTSQTSINAYAFPMSALAIRLAVVVQRPVVDKTGDTRKFDFNLKWAPDGLQGGGSGSTELPTLFTAVEEQLGLRLESRKVPVDVVVIDSAELPGEN